MRDEFRKLCCPWKNKCYTLTDFVALVTLISSAVYILHFISNIIITTIIVKGKRSLYGTHLIPKCLNAHLYNRNFVNYHNFTEVYMIWKHEIFCHCLYIIASPELLANNSLSLIMILDDICQKKCKWYSGKFENILLKYYNHSM